MFFVFFFEDLKIPFGKLTAEQLDVLSELAEENFAHRVELERRDEFDELARAYNRLAEQAGYQESIRQNYRAKENRYLVEFHKKFAIPFACVVFALLGVPMAVTTSRSGKGVSVSLAIFVFLVYYLFLVGGEKFADRGLVDPGEELVDQAGDEERGPTRELGIGLHELPQIAHQGVGRGDPRLDRHAGRPLGVEDIEGNTASVVVNETLASAIWPDLDPLGRRSFRHLTECGILAAGGGSHHQDGGSQYEY